MKAQPEKLAENQDWSPWPDVSDLVVGRDTEEPEEFVYVGLQSLDLRLHLQCFGGRPKLMLWFVSFSFVLRQEAMDFIILPMVFCPIRPLVYQTSADLGRFMMLR